MTRPFLCRAAVAGLVAQVSSLGRAAEEAASRAGRADDRAREAMGFASQNQTAITGVAAVVTQLTRQVENAEQRVSCCSYLLAGVNSGSDERTTAKVDCLLRVIF